MRSNVLRRSDDMQIDIQYFFLRQPRYGERIFHVCLNAPRTTGFQQESRHDLIQRLPPFHSVLVVPLGQLDNRQNFWKSYCSHVTTLYRRYPICRFPPIHAFLYFSIFMVSVFCSCGRHVGLAN